MTPDPPPPADADGALQFDTAEKADAGVSEDRAAHQCVFCSQPIAET